MSSAHSKSFWISVAIASMMAIASCSDSEAGSEKPRGIALSSPSIEGYLVDLGSGSRVGLFNVDRSKGALIAVEMMNLQDGITRSMGDVAFEASSDVSEVDCAARTIRIIGTAFYRRTGEEVLRVHHSGPVDGRDSAARLVEMVCDQSYASSSVAKFQSIDAFLGLFDLRYPAGPPPRPHIP